MMKKEETFEVDVKTLVYGGDAVGKMADGRAIFIRGGLPGEKVLARITEEKQRFARGEVVEILTPSPDRIAPRFPDEAECGGCHYQHMTYEAQLRAKTEIVRDQLQRIAGVKQPPVKPIVPSPRQWNYRSTVQFHLTDDGRLGFQMPGSHRVAPVDECALCEDALNELLPLLEFDAVPDGVERIELRVGGGGDIMMIFEGHDPTPPDLSVDLPISVVHLVEDDEGSTYMVVMAGDDHIVTEVLGRAYRVSAGSFFQVNTGQAENMVKYLLETLPLGGDQTLLEVYAGVGLFSAFLAPRVGRLAAVELAHSAIEDFAANLDEFENVEIYEGLAEAVLPALDLRPDLILVDPPRAGVALPALDAIIHMAPAALAYISCDPATLARDAKRLLAAGYRLESVQPFDMFPQTYHIESITLFVKSTGK